MSDTPADPMYELVGELNHIHEEKKRLEQRLREAEAVLRQCRDAVNVMEVDSGAHFRDAARAVDDYFREAGDDS